ncbi:MAG: hypothetical protein ABSC94_05310 [Polyangiaceae bacterium]|jgi:hypothetical protein
MARCERRLVVAAKEGRRERVGGPEPMKKTLNLQGVLALHARQEGQQRAHLDLQVNLLSEQKVAKVVALIEELRRDLPNVQDRKDSLADAMSNAVDPSAVISVPEENLDARRSQCEGAVNPDAAESSSSKTKGQRP